MDIGHSVWGSDRGVVSSSSCRLASLAIPLIYMVQCWSCRSSFCSRSTDWAGDVVFLGRMPTTSARGLISLLGRSSGLVL